MPNKIDVEIQEKNKSYPIYMDTNPLDELMGRILSDLDYPKYLEIGRASVGKECSERC